MFYRDRIKIKDQNAMKSQKPGVTLPSLIKGDYFMASGIARPHLNKEL